MSNIFRFGEHAADTDKLPVRDNRPTCSIRHWGFYFLQEYNPNRLADGKWSGASNLGAMDGCLNTARQAVYSAR